MLKTVHLTLQGKKGTGKSYTASMLAQYLQTLGAPVSAVDLDPANATLSPFSAIGAKPVQVVEDGEVNRRRYDRLISGILRAVETAHLVVDASAASFVSLFRFLLQSRGLQVLQRRGLRVLVHRPVCGGAALNETLNCLVVLLRKFQEIPFVVWLNAFFGPIMRPDRSFRETTVFKGNQGRIAAVLSHPGVETGPLGADIRAMTLAGFTFENAIHSQDFSILSRQRLKLYWAGAIQRLNSARFLEATA